MAKTKTTKILDNSLEVNDYMSKLDHPHKAEAEAVRAIIMSVIINDQTGLLEGDYPDRRLAYFRSMDDVRAKKESLEKAIRGWTQVMDEQS